MKRRYSLNAKINALNQIDQLDGDLAFVSRQLGIPAKTLEKWRAREPELRHCYQERQWRYLDRLRFDLHAQMLERVAAILERMDDSAIAKAPLNQLNDALASLLSHIRKFEESEQDLETPHETIKRAEFYYDGQVQDAPPWAGASAGQPRAVQGGRLRPPLGQDRIGQNGASGRGSLVAETDLVAGADLHDGQPGLARLESQRQIGQRGHDQRERTPD